MSSSRPYEKLSFVLLTKDECPLNSEARLHDGFLCLSAYVILSALLRLTALIIRLAGLQELLRSFSRFYWPFRLIPIVLVGALWEAASLGA